MAKTQNSKGRHSAPKQGTRIAGKQGKQKPTYQKQPKQEQLPTYAPLLDQRTKQDILGVTLVVVSLALFVCSVIHPEGVVTSAISEGLSTLLGVGAVVLPFLLLGLAVTVLVRTKRERFTARTALGLALLFVAFITLVALGTPGAEGNPDLVFSQLYLTSHGGLVGGGIAWVMLTLFGLVVSVIVMFGLIVISLLVTGFSLGWLIEKIRDRIPADDVEQPTDTFSHLPFARVNRNAQAPGADRGEAASLPTRKLSARRPEASATPQTAHPDDTLLFDAQGPAEKMPLTRKLADRKPTPEPAEETAGQPTKVLPAKRKRPVTPTAAPKRQEGFELPDMGLLNVSRPTKQTRAAAETLKETAYHLQETLSDFGIAATVVDWVAGPTVTLFKVDLPAGVRVSRVTALTDDIALALASPGVRVFAPVPGTNYVGIEVPNREHQTVLLGDCLKEAPDGPLQVAIGKDVEGNVIVSDLAKMPHLLIGGTTGSGKSVAINGMIMSILMRTTPAEVRMIMIDPKRVEFTPYNGIPNLFVPVVTECKEAAAALSWAVAEMERRLKEFSKMGVRNIGQYNAKIQAHNEEAEEADQREEEPYIVVIIDELADLMMNVGKEVEFSISRLAQLARAAGIHMIVATQRPSANVVTGLIKANITNRMALNVATGIDSRVILDQTGAENLIGNGDLLLSKPEWAKPQRIQGCYVSEDEIEAVVEQLKSQGEPDYHTDILQTNVIQMGDTNPDGSGGVSGPDDPLVWEAAEIVCSSGLGSTSNLQRRLSVGYARAGRIMDNLEEKGIVGPPNGSRPRDVLIDSLELEALKALEMAD